MLKNSLKLFNICLVYPHKQNTLKLNIKKLWLSVYFSNNRIIKIKLIKMSKLIFAVWSTNEDKISWINLWLDWLNSWEIISNLNEYQENIWMILKEYFKKEIKINSYKTESWIDDMPTSLQETILWAGNRAINLIDLDVKADYYLWVEWWIEFCDFSKSLLYSVVCIIDKCGNLNIWTSNWLSIWVEDTIRLKKWDDLSDIIKDKHWQIWNWSISWDLSLNKFPRAEQFKIAFKSAMIPFFNKKYY